MVAPVFEGNSGLLGAVFSALAIVQAKNDACGGALSKLDSISTALGFEKRAGSEKNC